MSNYFLIVSDKPISNHKLPLRETNLCSEIIEIAPFTATKCYHLMPVADIEKTETAKKLAPKIYKKTARFFFNLYEMVCDCINRNQKIGLVMTHYNDVFDLYEFQVKTIETNVLKQEYFSFEFNVFYEFIHTKVSTAYDKLF